MIRSRNPVRRWARVIAPIVVSLGLAIGAAACGGSGGGGSTSHGNGNTAF